MRSTRWLLALILSAFFFITTVVAQSPRTLSDLPPEAQAAIRAATKRRAAPNEQSTQGQSIWPQLAKLTATGFTDYFGGSVAISGDTVVVGSPLGEYQGALYVFTKPKTGWTNMTQVATLTASDGQTNLGLGCSVAIDGDTIVGGASGSDYSGCYYSFGYQGAVYVFVKPEGGWTNMTQTAKLTTSDPLPSHIGPSVSISGDTVVAGGPSEYPSEILGAAYVFVKPATGWTNMSQTAKLTASDGMPGDQLGSSVAISGTTIFAGADQQGVYPYGTGKAYVYVKPAGGWANGTQTAELAASDGKSGDGFGYAVAASANSAVLGAPAANSGTGAAYVFVEPSGGWMNMTETAELIDAGGYSVAINREIAVAGAAYYTNGPNDREGAAFVFIKPKDGWKSTSSYDTKLTGSDARIVTFFGTSVAIDGGIVLAGAPWDQSGFYTYKGAAYVYTYP